MSNDTPDQAARTAYPPAIDLAAVLSALQDQIDDLTAVADSQQRRLTELERRLRG